MSERSERIIRGMRASRMRGRAKRALGMSERTMGVPPAGRWGRVKNRRARHDFCGPADRKEAGA
ncbi:hypothetical protein GCM10010211_04390 [Streptomyces albospinus]|uniref:Uncharacterized protein n=1 Tax=Streptomyces albospinus TaxID=285515 RepID=A0ABQ2UMA5_9ACTN|nr:hypothetical protein GCM10010211_04390 [Streptomyces albospinus]